MSEVKIPNRPEPGGYPTFTSRKKASTLPYQKPLYGTDEHKIRRLVFDKVTVTLQENVEFDAYRECEVNPYFKKLVLDGYLKEGKLIKLDPHALQRYLVAQVSADTNKVILWNDRPRPAREIELEKAISSRDAKIKANASEMARMRALLEKNKIPFEVKE
jgi:hypothetical protein